MRTTGQRPRVLLICGTMNHTTQMHQIARHLPGWDHFYTPYYCDPPLAWLQRLGLLEFVALGRKHWRRCLGYLREHELALDVCGRRYAGRYDLVVTASDLIIPRNIRGSRIVLIQEGMTDPENWMYKLCRALPFLPRWLGGSSLTGLSLAYDKFCVASEGYRDLFIRKGVPADRIVVTGIPNFDNCARFYDNSFPHRGFVLACTSDCRETFRRDNRARFIQRVAEIASGRQIIFKLHPNEKVSRATREIQRHAPGALVFSTGSAEEMIANCDVLITQWSSTAYVGLALGKEVHSYFDVDELRRLLPLQNNAGARNIAAVCREVAGVVGAGARGRSLAA
jgi:hypothetical protein